jgi:hypothetical protein
MLINPIFISTAVLESAKVLRMATTSAKTKKEQLSIDAASRGLLGLIGTVHGHEFYAEKIQQRINAAREAIVAFQKDFPVTEEKKDYLDPKTTNETTQACIKVWRLALRTAKTAEERTAIEMAAMGMAMVASMPATCGFYSGQTRWASQSIEAQCQEFLGKTEAQRKENYNRLLSSAD